MSEPLRAETPAAFFTRFLRFGLLAWGGPVAQIAMLKRELVEEEGWVSPARFNRLLAIYQVLPGPEAHELCALLTALGYLIAWPMDSTQGFHAVMSVFLMPMWLLSGAFFPLPEQGWLAWIMRANPLTYGLAGLRRLMSAGDPLSVAALPGWTTCAAVTLVMAAGLFIADVALTRLKHVG